MKTAVNVDVEIDEIRKTKIFSWTHENKIVSIKLSSNFDYVLSSNRRGLIFESVKDLIVCNYDCRGLLINNFDIPIREGYKYFGVRESREAIFGLVLIYAPMKDGYGNEWKDLEQYEPSLMGEEVGKFVGIYR